MQELNSSLLREKFVILDPKGKTNEERATVALSNRFVVDLKKPESEHSEKLVVRGQNMHSVARMAARLIYDYDNTGPISTRKDPYDWEKVWDSIVNDYEYAYNPQRWIAVYKDGKRVFSAGELHPLLDMIEICDHGNKNDYDYAIPMAEKLLKQNGQNLEIDHDANVALSVNFENNEGRLGIILRGSNKTTTFSFSTKPKQPNQAMNIPQCLGAAAAFLEGVQLAFLVGMNMEKIRINIIERFSKEEKQTKEGRLRLQRLNTEISNMEAAFDVRYRPEKPEFHVLVNEAEALGQRILTPPEDKSDSVESGENAGDAASEGDEEDIPVIRPEDSN